MLEQTYISGDGAVNIARSVEQSVASGKLGAGHPLPPVRDLARQLGVSGATVAAAYRLLRDRGVVIADGRRGTHIRPAAPITAPAPAPLRRGTRDLAAGNPDPALLPDLRTAVRRMSLAPRVYGEDLNDKELIALARRQFAADRVPAKAVTVVSGALDGIERVLREHLRPGDRVIVEDPCFTGIADLLAVLALAPIPVPVDDEGMRVEELRLALKRGAAAIIVTPRAQNPTGAAFSAKRARQLRALLHGKNILLVEDDHAAAIAGKPYRTLVTRESPRWAVVRSVSKSLGPDLRLALMAADANTVARVQGRQTLGIRWVSHVLQRLVVTLLRDKRVKRQLAKAAKTYAQRRNALKDALMRQGLPAHGESGLNVWIPVAEEGQVTAELLRRGWAVMAGNRYRIATATAIRVTVAALEPRDASRFASDLAAILSPPARAPLT